jgi:hypothetical protein
MRSDGHLLYLWTPQGYRLEERDGDAPAVGTAVDLGDGARYGVQKVGVSPYPGDARPCAFVSREP